MNQCSPLGFFNKGSSPKNTSLKPMNPETYHSEQLRQQRRCLRWGPRPTKPANHYPVAARGTGAGLQEGHEPPHRPRALWEPLRWPRRGRAPSPLHPKRLASTRDARSWRSAGHAPQQGAHQVPRRWTPGGAGRPAASMSMGLCKTLGKTLYTARTIPSKGPGAQILLGSKIKNHGEKGIGGLDSQHSGTWTSPL